MTTDLNENNQRLARSSTYSHLTQTYLTASNLNSSFHKLADLNTQNILIPADAVQHQKPLSLLENQLSLTRSFKLKPLSSSNNPTSRNHYCIVSNRITSAKSQRSQAQPKSAVDVQQPLNSIENPVKTGFRPSFVLKAKSKFLKVSPKEPNPQVSYYAVNANQQSPNNPTGTTTTNDQVGDLTNESFLSRRSYDPHLTSLRSSFTKLDMETYKQKYLDNYTNTNMNLTTNSIVENEQRPNVTLVSQNQTTQSPALSKSKTNFTDDSFMTNELNNMSERDFLTLLKKYRETKDSAVFVHTPTKNHEDATANSEAKHVVGKIKTYAFQIERPPSIYHYNYLNTGDYIVPIESIIKQQNQDVKATQQDYFSNFGRKESPLHQLQRLHRQKTDTRTKRREQYPSFFIDYINNKFEVRNYNKFVNLLKKKEANKEKPKIMYAKINTKIENLSDV
jgi:hypothetical protein